MSQFPNTRQALVEYVQRNIDFHLERADDLERFGDRWWRVSKWAWLCAARAHRAAAHEMTQVLDLMASVERAEASVTEGDIDIHAKSPESIIARIQGERLRQFHLGEK